MHVVELLHVLLRAEHVEGNITSLPESIVAIAVNRRWKLQPGYSLRASQPEEIPDTAPTELWIIYWPIFPRLHRGLNDGARYAD